MGHGFSRQGPTRIARAHAKLENGSSMNGFTADTGESCGITSFDLSAELVEHDDECFLQSEDGQSVRLELPEKGKMLRIRIGPVAICVDACSRIVMQTE
jgi:hypothetical protein